MSRGQVHWVMSRGRVHVFTCQILNLDKIAGKETTTPNTICPFLDTGAKNILFVSSLVKITALDIRSKFGIIKRLEVIFNEYFKGYKTYNLS